MRFVHCMLYSRMISGLKLGAARAEPLTSPSITLLKTCPLISSSLFGFTGWVEHSRRGCFVEWMILQYWSKAIVNNSHRSNSVSVSFSVSSPGHLLPHAFLPNTIKLSSDTSQASAFLSSSSTFICRPF
jgi:hypothetical protein